MPPARPPCLERSQLVDGFLILAVLAVFGVLAIFIWPLKGFVQQLQDFLDALPGFFASWHRARRAMRDPGERETSLNDAEPGESSR